MVFLMLEDGVSSVEVTVFIGTNRRTAAVRVKVVL